MSRQQALQKSPAGLDVEQTHQFVADFQGKPYINKDGRRFKMDQRFGAGGYQVLVNPPPREEYIFLLSMMGFKEGDPCIVMKAEIFVDGNKLAEDYGYATPKNCRAGQKQFDNDGLHIAVTRAVNRAMGMLVAGGFSDPDNIYEGPTVHTNPENDHVGYVPATGSAQVDFLNECAALKKKIGPEDYYATLHSFGYEKSNDPELCSNGEEMSKLIRALTHLAQPQIHPDPEPPTTDHFLEQLEADLDALDGVSDALRPTMFRDIAEDVSAHEALDALHEPSNRTLRSILIEKASEFAEIDDVLGFTGTIRKAIAMIRGFEASQAVF